MRIAFNRINFLLYDLYSFRLNRFHLLSHLSLIIQPPSLSHIDSTNMNPIQLLFEKLIHRKSNSLTRSNTHDPRSDTLVESMKPFLFEHVTRDRPDSGDGGLVRLSWRLLKSRFDRIDWCVAQGAHGAGDETDQESFMMG